MEDNKKKFVVTCSFRYVIEAEDEESALEALEEDMREPLSVALDNSLVVTEAGKMPKSPDEAIQEFCAEIKEKEGYMKERGDDPHEVNKWDLEGSDNSIWENGYAHGMLHAIETVKKMKDNQREHALHRRN